ncbi:MAG: CBS domain-containing protein [Deltaproteobacteria bacterium]|nr:CBS domain-containing protein [Deltaproteobacteria bacterium]
MGASEFEEAYGADESQRNRDAQRLGESILREKCGGVGIHDALTVPHTATIREAIDVMVQNRVGCVLVVDGKTLVGIFTERDVMTRVVHNGIAQDRPITDAMTPDPAVLGPNDPLVFLLNRMVDGGFRHVPIVDLQSHPLGVISVRGVVEWVVSHVRRAVLNLPPRVRESYPPQREGG